MNCRACGAPLSADEMGLHRKLINRGDTTFLCKACLAKEFHCTTELLDQKIEQFRAMGCTLFEPIKTK